MDWHALTVKKVLSELKSRRSGLTDSEVLAKRKKFGRNEFTFEKPPFWLFILLRQFSSPLVYLLLGAMGVAIFIRDFESAVMIAVAVFINTIFGFIQENRVNRILWSLKRYIPHEVRVKRNGQIVALPAQDLVPGDILILEAGDKIPADARIISAHSFQVNEAVLTGEAFPVGKHERVVNKNLPISERSNIIFSGTIVLSGRAEAVVFATGRNSEFAKIAKLISPKDIKTPLEERLEKFSLTLTFAVLFLALLSFALGALTGKTLVQMLILSTALAVSAIPEGLLVTMTIILAVGMLKILKKGSIVKSLLAAETLGSVNVICADKTGTITTGALRLVGIEGKNWVCNCNNEHWEPSLSYEKMMDALRAAILASDAVIENPSEAISKWKVLGDLLEAAIFRAAGRLGQDILVLKKRNPITDEIPFDPQKKYMAVLTASGKIFVKGAPEKIIEICRLSPKEKFRLYKLAERKAAKGLRVLAVAKKSAKYKKSLSEKDVNALVFLGFLYFEDPLREGAKEVLDEARKAGIRSVIITGDHPNTALRVAKDLGLDISARKMMTGRELNEIGERGLTKVIKNIQVFARATPVHKLWITRAWKKAGFTVAMTGDGVNDAPALADAHIGIALGSGTEVAKEASDLVLLDNNFKTILSAIEQGRIIFDNLRKVITYQLSDSFSEVILVIGSLILGLPLPLTAAMILWINLISDGFPSIALAFEPGESDVMKLRPISRRQALLNGEMVTIIFAIGIITDLLLLGLFYFLLKNGQTLQYAQTVVFAALGLDSLIYVFSIKSLRRPIFHIRIFNNKLLILAVLVGLLFHLSAFYLPPLRNFFGLTILSALDWLFLAFLGIVKVFAFELVKWIFIARKRV